MGTQARVQLGRALESMGSTRDAWVYDASVSNGFDLTKDSFVQSNVVRQRAPCRASREPGGRRRGALLQPPRPAPASTTPPSRPTPYDNPDIPGPLTIGGDKGLRGYPLRYQAGERRVLATVEARAYSDWYPFRLFRVGGAVFYDTGRAWHGENQNTVNSGWLRDVGFGLRLLSARTSKGNVLHADIAFPARPRSEHRLGPVPGEDPGRVLGRYMLRRYWPPTSNSACVICPSEQTRTASISTANTFSFSITACRRRSSIGADCGGVARVEIAQALQLRLLLVLGGADQLELLRRRIGVRVAEGVDADDRVGAVVLLVLVVERLFLDLAALVAGLHRAEHAAAARDRLELLQHRLLDQVGELLDRRTSPGSGSRSSPGPTRG